jgi:hypothetical protein
MAKISVCRKKNWTISSKMFEVFLDEKRIGYLMNGETSEYDVSAGEHHLKVKMGRFGSKDFNFTMFSNQTRSFTVFVSKMSLSIAAIFLMGIFLFRYYLRTLKLDHNYSMLTPLLILLLGIYFQTIGRNTYLKVKES